MKNIQIVKNIRDNGKNIQIVEKNVDIVEKIYIQVQITQWKKTYRDSGKKIVKNNIEIVVKIKIKIKIDNGKH